MVFPVSSEISDLVRDPGRISEENKLNATTQQFITAKISGCVLKQRSKTNSSLRQRNLQLQNEAALASCRMRAVEHRKSAVGLAGAHPGLPDWLFHAKFHKFSLFRGTWRQTFVWLFLLNIWLFLEAVGTRHQAGVLAFQMSC